MSNHYIAVDGDNVGILLSTPIILNQLSEIASISREITNYFAQLGTLFEAKGYEVVFCAGDSLLAYSTSATDLPWLAQLPRGVCTFSIGIGATPEFAYLALQLAKARGKNQVVEIWGTTAETLHKW